MRIDRHAAGNNDFDEQLMARFAAGIEQTLQLPILAVPQIGFIVGVL
jgi:hypothetical protein